MRRRAVYRRSGGGFRYLHDEISGGLFAISHLQCKSAYVGNSIQVGGVDYGFVNGIVDVAAIDSANAGDATSQPYYDQVGSNDMPFASTTPFYDKSENEFPNCQGATYKNGSVSGGLASLNTTDPFTSIHVIKHNTGSYATQEWFMSFEGSNSHRFMWQSNNLRFLLQTGVNLTLDVSGVNDSNLKMIVCDYDGSLNSTGMNIYQNDMVTPLTASKSGAGGGSVDYFGNFGISGRASNGVGRYNGFIYETHIFNKVLSQSERETAKEILEQYYTFPS